MYVTNLSVYLCLDICSLVLAASLGISCVDIFLEFPYLIYFGWG